MDTPIIDFHTHATGIDYDKPFRKHNITHAITIPFGYPRGRRWEDMMVIAGMCPKPDWYIKFLTEQLPDLNWMWYENIKTANEHLGKVPYFTLVPWISLEMDIDRVKTEKWFSESKMVKIIPVFDDIPPAKQESWEDNYLPKLHTLVGKLPQKVIMIHTGWGSSPVLYNNLIGHYPEKTFILAHMKEDDDSDNIERQAIMKKYANAYLEMSYLSSPKRLAQYVNMGFGSRILFGTDYRTDADECTLQWMIEAVKLAPISDEARRCIFYTNAKELLQKIGVEQI